MDTTQQIVNARDEHDAQMALDFHAKRGPAGVTLARRDDGFVAHCPAWNGQAIVVSHPAIVGALSDELYNTHEGMIRADINKSAAKLMLSGLGSVSIVAL